MTATRATTSARTRRLAKGGRYDRHLDARVLEAASALLAERGYEGMSVDAIAARAGVGKAAIYRRWAGKAELVLDVVRAAGFPVDEVRNTGTLRGDLLAMLENLRRRLDARGMAHVAGVVVAMREHDELRAAVHEQLVSAWAQATEAIVARAVARGEIAPRPPASLELFAQLAPALVSLRILASMGEVGSEFMTQLVDEVLLPVLEAAPA